MEPAHPLYTLINVPLQAIGGWIFGEEEVKQEERKMGGNTVGEVVNKNLESGGFHFVEFHIGSVGGGMVLMLVAMLVMIGIWYACGRRCPCKIERRRRTPRGNPSPPFYTPEASWNARASWGAAIPMVEMQPAPTAPRYAIETQVSGEDRLAPPTTRRLDQLQC